MFSTNSFSNVCVEISPFFDCYARLQSEENILEIFNFSNSKLIFQETETNSMCYSKNQNLIFFSKLNFEIIYYDYKNKEIKDKITPRIFLGQNLTCKLTETYNFQLYAQFFDLSKNSNTPPFIFSWDPTLEIIERFRSDLGFNLTTSDKFISCLNHDGKSIEVFDNFSNENTKILFEEPVNNIEMRFSPCGGSLGIFEEDRISYFDILAKKLMIKEEIYRLNCFSIDDYGCVAFEIFFENEFHVHVFDLSQNIILFRKTFQKCQNIILLNDGRILTFSSDTFDIYQINNKSIFKLINKVKDLNFF
jgi:hypothetical protein